MEQKQPEVTFPSKKLSPTSSKPAYINKLLNQEKMGWSFLNDHHDTSQYFNTMTFRPTSTLSRFDMSAYNVNSDSEEEQVQSTSNEKREMNLMFTYKSRDKLKIPTHTMHIKRNSLQPISSNTKAPFFGATNNQIKINTETSIYQISNRDLFGSELSKLTRSNRNQKTLDAIKNKTHKMKTELNQLTKEIYDNVLEYHQSPGALNSETIDIALKKKLWSG